MKLEEECFTEEGIKKIISSKFEESINIEFKANGALSNVNSVKKEISKDVSSFANSDGGYIFYGISEIDHVADSMSYVDGNLYTKEWLENIIISSTQPRIQNLKIYPIRFESDLTKTVYAVEIPFSEDAPHINRDKKYYKRYNFQSVPMEEYEIKNLYFRQGSSIVTFLKAVVKPTEQNDDDKISFYTEIVVTNEGRFIVEKYKVAVNFKNADGCNISAHPLKKYSFTNKLEEGVALTSTELIPIFPEEQFAALSFTLTFSKSKFFEICETIECELIIHNKDATEFYDYDIAPTLIKIKETYYDTRQY